MTLFFKYILLSTILLIVSSCGTFSQKSPEKAELHMQLGLSYLDRKNYPIALKELLLAEEADPENYHVQNNLGLVYFIRGKYDLSIKHFSQAYKINPKFTEAKNNLARVNIEIKQFTTAQKLLDQVLADLTFASPEKAYMNYGLLEFNRSRFKQAKLYFKKVLEINREDCIAHVYYGRSFLELKENRPAIELLEKSISFCQPIGIDEAHYFSAIALYRDNQKSQSLARFNEVLKLFPEGVRVEPSKKMITLIEKGSL